MFSSTILSGKYINSEIMTGESPFIAVIFEWRFPHVHHMANLTWHGQSLNMGTSPLGESPSIHTLIIWNLLAVEKGNPLSYMCTRNHNVGKSLFEVERQSIFGLFSLEQFNFFDSLVNLEVYFRQKYESRRRLKTHRNITTYSWLGFGLTVSQLLNMKSSVGNLNFKFLILVNLSL